MRKEEVNKLISELGSFEQKTAQLLVDPTFRIMLEAFIEHGFTADHVYNAYKLLQDRAEKVSNG